MKKTLVLLFLASFSLSALATTVPLTFVKSNNGHMSVAVDSVTGKFYERNGYSGGASLKVFDSAADFEANNQSSTVNLAPGYNSTYATAANGQLFGRTDTSTSAIGRWSLATGSLEATSSIAGMGGVNGTHTFDWGGYSGVNWLQDQTGIYVMGKDQSGPNWQVNRMDNNLNVLETKTFTPQNTGGGNYGFAFMIEGQLFLGRDYHSGAVVDVFDFASGILNQDSFQLDAPANYWGNTFYDTNADTLYLNAVSGTRGFYKVADASSAFGVAVPEPAQWALLLLGLALTLRQQRAS